jgi:hypothetical protein
MSHTALVNVDADATSKLSSFIAELTGDNKTEFIAQCDANKSQPVELLQTLLSKTDLILALENEKGWFLCLFDIDFKGRYAAEETIMLLLLLIVVADAEGCFQAIIAILHSTVNDSADEQKVIKSLTDNLSASDNALVALRVFVSVLNLLRCAPAKFQVLKGKYMFAHCIHITNDISRIIVMSVDSCA